MSVQKLLTGSASVWRLICANGLMVSSEFANFSHKHIGFSPDDFMNSANEIANSAGEIAGRVDDMKLIEMTQVERGVFAQAAHNLVYDVPEEAPIYNTPNFFMNGVTTIKARICGLLLI